eukprot:5655262-Amphidinium_carterae.1
MEEFPFGVVEGYALGLWQVRGWHRGPTGEPLDGWLARGSSEVNLYFDKTGHPQHKLPEPHEAKE